MKYILCVLLFLTLTCINVFSQNLSGRWKGNLEVNGIELPIIFRFEKDTAGNYQGTWDSPKQNAMNLPYSTIRVNRDSVDITIDLVAGSYKGKFISKDSIAGTWKQRGVELPLNFTHTSDSLIKELPYPGEKEISVYSAVGSKIYGTLLAKNNKQKIAIIIAGSGPTDRNGNSSIAPSTNEYKLLAHALDSQNIASFRYDKRGIAKSSVPNFKEKNLVFDDYVKDAEKIFDYLHDTLGFKNIYFIGHSEGSLIGMLASQKKKVKGYISVAGAGRPIDIILEEQFRNQPLPDSVKEKIPGIFNRLKEGKEVSEVPKSLTALFRKSIQPYLISWLKYSPQKEIAKLKCPILILQGSCDIQVKVEDANNLHDANKESTLDIIPSMSHTLKNAGENCVNENETYTDGKMPLDRRLVEDIVKFIN